MPSTLETTIKRYGRFSEGSEKDQALPEKT